MEWRVGAKFKRPHGDLLGGDILTVSHLTEWCVYAVEDGLNTRIEDCELVG